MPPPLIQWLRSILLLDVSIISSSWQNTAMGNNILTLNIHDLCLILPRSQMKFPDFSLTLPNLSSPSWSCNTCRITWLRSFYRCQEDPRQSDISSACCTGSSFSRELTTKWLCWRSTSTTHQHCPISIACSRRKRKSTTCNADQPLRHCASVPTIHQGDNRKASIPLHSTGYMELDAKDNCQQWFCYLFKI